MKVDPPDACSWCGDAPGDVYCCGACERACIAANDGPTDRERPTEQEARTRIYERELAFLDLPRGAARVSR